MTWCCDRERLERGGPQFRQNMKDRPEAADEICQLLNRELQAGHDSYDERVEWAMLRTFRQIKWCHWGRECHDWKNHRSQDCGYSHTPEEQLAKWQLLQDLKLLYFSTHSQPVYQGVYAPAEMEADWIKRVMYQLHDGLTSDQAVDEPHYLYTGDTVWNGTSVRSKSSLFLHVSGPFR